MANYTLPSAEGGRPPKNVPAAGAEACDVVDLNVDPTSVDYMGGVNTIEFGFLPADHVLTDFTLVSEDLDSNGTPTLTFDVGIRDADGAGNDDPNAIIAGATVGRGGGVARMDQAAVRSIKRSSSDRKLYLNVSAAAATSAAGKIRFQWRYVAIDPRDLVDG